MNDVELVATIVGVIGLAAFCAFVLLAIIDKSDGKWS